MMDANEVAERLRACAAEMRHASIALRAHADQLKETSRTIGNDAAKILHPILLEDEQGAGPSAPLWEFMLPTLRKVLAKPAVAELDRDAFKVARIVEFTEHRCSQAECGAWDDSWGSKLASEWKQIRLSECDLTEPQRERFYFDQAREWAELIELAADHVREVPIQVRFIQSYNRLYPSQMKQADALKAAAIEVGYPGKVARQRLGEWGEKFGVKVNQMERNRGKS